MLQIYLLSHILRIIYNCQFHLYVFRKQKKITTKTMFQIVLDNNLPKLFRSLCIGNVSHGIKKRNNKNAYLRDKFVHWSIKRAIFSILVGINIYKYVQKDSVWSIVLYGQRKRALWVCLRDTLAYSKVHIQIMGQCLA